MTSALTIIQQPPKPLIQIVDSPVMMTIQPELAVEIGLNESILLRQIAFWIKTSNNCRDGQWWTYQSLSEMRDKAFKFWSVSTISRVVNKLVELGLIEKTDRYNPRRNDRTQWFALNIEKLQELTSIEVILQDEKPNVTKPITVLQDEKTVLQSATPILQNETGILQSATTLPEITTEITTEKKNREKEQRPRDPGESEKKPAPVLQELDNAFGRCCRHFETEKIGKLNARSKEQLTAALDDYGEDWLMQAINIASDNSVRKWSYVIGILEKCKAEGHAPNAKAAPAKQAAAASQPPETDWAAQAEKINTPLPIRSDRALIEMWYRGGGRFMSDEDKTRLDALLAEIDTIREAGQPEPTIDQVAS